MEVAPNDPATLSGATGSPRTQEFLYTPLSDASKCIRLLRMRPFSPRDSISSFEMTKHDMGDLPEYAAISYVWGSSSERHQVLIDESYMEVNSSAHAALTQACNLNRTAVNDEGDDHVYLWMDTICINQQDLREKGLQVMMMAEIYQMASVVYACIGSHDDGSEVLPEFLDALWDVHQGNETDEDEQDYSLAVQWLLTQDEDYLSKACGAFSRFAHRPYWTRMWIVQEICMAECCLVMCGPDSFNLNDVFLFENVFEALLEEPLPDTVRTIVDAEWAYMSEGFMSRAINNNKEDRNTPGACLQRMKDFKCRDPRDRIYALNAMIQWGKGQPRLEPNYAQSTFDLLVQALGHVTLADSELNTKHPAETLCERVNFGVLEALSIDASHKQIRATVAGLQQQAPTMPPDLGQKWPLLLRETSYAFDRIASDQGGRLTVSFHQTSHESSKETAELFEHFGTVEHDSSALGGLFEGRTPQQLFAGSAVAGIICSGAKSGDYLYPCNVPVAMLQRTSQLYIVIRDSSDSADGSCVVVGQALMFSNYEADIQFPTWSELERSQFRLVPANAVFELTLTAKDVVVLMGQDYNAQDVAPTFPSTRPWPKAIPPKRLRQSRNVLTRERFQRLATAVTMSPGCGARMIDFSRASVHQQLSALNVATQFAAATRGTAEKGAFLISQTKTGFEFMGESVPARYFAGPISHVSEGKCPVHGSRQLADGSIFERNVQAPSGRLLECVCHMSLWTITVKYDFSFPFRHSSTTNSSRPSRVHSLLRLAPPKHSS